MNKVGYERKESYHYCKCCYHHRLARWSRCLRHADANDCADSNGDDLSQDCDANGADDCCCCLQRKRLDRADFRVTVSVRHFQHALGSSEGQRQHLLHRHRLECR